MKDAWLLLPVAASVAALVAGGLLGIPAVVGGALAGLVTARLGAGRPAVAFAAAAPPLLGGGFAAIGVALLLALLWAYVARGWAWAFLAGGLAGAVLPNGAMVTPLAAGAFLAVAPWPVALLALPVGAAAWVVSPATTSPLIPGLVLASAGAARYVAGHAANVTMARRVLSMGLVTAPVPAAVGLVMVALGRGPEPVWAILKAAMVAGAAGALFLAAHVGSAVVLRSSSGGRALWLAWTWGAAAALVALAAQPGARLSFSTSSIVSILAVPAGLGLAWVLATRKRGAAPDASAELSLLATP